MSLLCGISFLTSVIIGVGTPVNEGVLRPAHGTAAQYRQVLMLEREFVTEPGGTLVIDLPDGNLDILTGTTSSTTVKVYVGARDRSWGREVFERMRFVVQGDRAEVRVSASEPRVQRSEWRQNHGVSVTVTVTIPPVFDAQVVTRDGDIRVANLEGRATLRTFDGDVVVERVRGPAISVRTSDGDIRAREIHAPSVELNTGDGDVDLREISGALTASTGDGDIRARLASGNEVSLRTGDGDITIYVPGDLAADLDLSGEELDLESRFMVDGGRVSKRALRGSVNGGGPLLQARAVDGTIVLRRW